MNSSRHSPRVPKPGSKSKSKSMSKTLPNHLDQRLHSALKDLQKIKRYYHSSEAPKQASIPSFPEEEEPGKQNNAHASETLIKKLYERNLALEREIAGLKKKQQVHRQQIQDDEKTRLQQLVATLGKSITAAMWVKAFGVESGQSKVTTDSEEIRERVKQKDFIIRHLQAEISQITAKKALNRKSEQDMKTKLETEYLEELSAVKKQCELLSQQNALLSSNLSSIVKSKAKKGVRDYVDTLEAQMEALQQDHRNQWQYITAKLQRYETENRDLFIKCKQLQDNAFLHVSSKSESEVNK